MKLSKYLSIFIILLVSAHTQATKCCTSYDKSNTLCLTCPDGSYFYGNNCMLDISNCQKYADCFSCAQCVEGFKMIDSQYNGQSIKRCQGQQDYSDINLEQKSEQDENYQAYLIADDYMRSFHKQVKAAKVVGAYSKRLQNSALSIQIQYSAQSQQNKYYRTFMQIQLTKYSFNQKLFSQITKNQLRKSNNVKVSKNNDPIDVSLCIGTVTTYDGYNQKLLDLRQSTNMKVIQAVDSIARGTNTIYKKILNIKVRTTNNQANKVKNLIEISYQLNNQNTNHTIAIQASTRRVISINGNPINGDIFNNILQKTQVNDKSNIGNLNEQTIIKSNIKDGISVSILNSSELKDKKQEISTSQVLSSSNSSNQIISISNIPFQLPLLNSSPTLKTDITTPPIKTDLKAITSISSQNKLISSGPTTTILSTPISDTSISSSLTKTTSSTSISATNIPKNPSDFWQKQSITGYNSESNMDLLKDIKFLVVKDFINKKLSGYQDLLPSSCFSKTETDFKTYMMTYDKKQQGIQTQVLCKIKIVTFTPQLIFEHKIKTISKQAPIQQKGPVFITRDLNQMKRQPYFIPAAIQVSKINPGYINANLVSISTNEENLNTIYYRCVYNINQKVWQVDSLTKKKLRIGQFISQKDITPINPIKTQNVGSKTAEKSSEKAIKSPTNQIAQTQTSSPSPSLLPSTVPTSQMAYPGAIIKTISTSALLTTSSPSTQAKTDSNGLSKQYSQKPVVPIKSSQKSTQKQSQSSASLTPRPNTNPSITLSPSPPILNKSNDSLLQNSKTCQLPKNTPKVQQILKFAQVSELSPNILAEIGGFSQIPLDDKLDPGFLKVQSYIECVQYKQLKDSKIIAAFNKIFGFSIQYKVFYEAPKKVIFQAYLANDRLKNKVYMVNFNPISFGVQ